MKTVYSIDTSMPESACTSHKRKSLASLHMDSLSPTFVPVCDQQGLYEVIQCNLYLAVCWCVNPHTGETIWGTHSHGLPDCSGQTEFIITNIPTQSLIGQLLRRVIVFFTFICLKNCIT